MPHDASQPLPDVHALVFHAQSLSDAEQRSGGAAAHGAAAPLPDGVAELVARLLAARVRVAVLACAGAAAELSGAQAAAAESAAALSSSDAAAQVEALAAATDAAIDALSAAAQRWGLAPCEVAVVAGAAAATALLAPARAAGFRAVLLSAADAASAPPAPPLPRAARAADVPRALASAADVVAGLLLTRRRELSLLRSGLLHPLPRRGVVALSVDAAAPLAPQGPWHVVLHKATDQLASDARPGALAFTEEVRALAAYVASHPRTALLEPLPRLSVAFDRGEACALLARLPRQPRSGVDGALLHAPLAAPAFAVLHSWETRHVQQALQAAGIELPCLLKPLIACGAPGSHAMALLLRADGGAAAGVALPAVAQAFICHDGVFHKCYAIGDATLIAPPRRSLPPPPAACAAAAVPFDALAVLPSRWAASTVDSAASETPPAAVDRAAVCAAAAWLRAQTGLRLLGFDVVVEERSGAHCVVDLNYFPSCGAAGAADAMAALLAAAAAPRNEEEEAVISRACVAPRNDFWTVPARQGARWPHFAVAAPLRATPGAVGPREAARAAAAAALQRSVGGMAGAEMSDDEGSVLTSAADAARVLVCLLSAARAARGMAPPALPAAAHRGADTSARHVALAPGAAAVAAVVLAQPGALVASRRRVIYCRPESRIDMAARSILQLLVARGAARWMREGRLRGALGNTPDISKGLRKLRSGGVVVRRGAGGRADPFRYMLKTAFLRLSPEAQRAPWSDDSENEGEGGSGRSSGEQQVYRSDANVQNPAPGYDLAPCSAAADAEEVAESGADVAEAALAAAAPAPTAVTLATALATALAVPPDACGVLGVEARQQHEAAYAAMV